MRYINKSNPCAPFSDYIAKSKPTTWDKASEGKKKRLAHHLHQEQGGLCAYCLEELPLPQGGNDTEIDISHVDHMRQKGKPEFKQLEFEQTNLVFSCKGYRYKETPPPFVRTERGRIKRTAEKGLQRECCGMYKDSQAHFEETKILFPTEFPDIETYFHYEANGKIVPNPLKSKGIQAQCEYTIDLLNLNLDYLQKQRQMEYDLFLEKTDEDIVILLEMSDRLNRFHAMLRYFFT
jgi:uncharacterized protein (TIGR02646 family)